MTDSENGAPTALPGTDPGRVVDKAALLSGTAFGITAIPIPGMGVIKVRPLSRAEAMAVYDQELSAAQMEQVLLSKACVEPTFTPGEVAAWQECDGAGGNILAVVNTILELSGMQVGAGKAAYKRFRGAS